MFVDLLVNWLRQTLPDAKVWVADTNRYIIFVEIFAEFPPHIKAQMLGHYKKEVPFISLEIVYWPGTVKMFESGLAHEMAEAGEIGPPSDPRFFKRLRTGIRYYHELMRSRYRNLGLEIPELTITTSARSL